MLRVLAPETVRLDLSDGEWLLVKKRLTAGEELHLQVLAGTTFVDGKANFDQLKAGIAVVLEYLLDWSATDLAGKPVPIRDQPPNVVRAALESLPGEGLREVQDAIFAHMGRVRQEIEDQKKVASGSSEPVAISASAN